MCSLQFNDNAWKAIYDVVSLTPVLLPDAFLWPGGPSPALLEREKERKPRLKAGPLKTSGRTRRGSSLHCGKVGGDVLLRN